MTEPEDTGEFRTQKCYWAEPYRAELDATVLDVRGSLLTLDRTIIYPFSGGQEQDRGSINRHLVVNALPRGKAVEYEIDPAHGLKPGEGVRVRIVWDRRYRLMRLHFRWEGSIARIFPDVTGKLKRIVESNTPIHSRFENEEEEMRFWEVPGFGKGKERIEIRLAD